MNLQSSIELVQHAFSVVEWKFLFEDATFRDKLKSIADRDDAEAAIALGRKLLTMRGKVGS